MKKIGKISSFVIASPSMKKALLPWVLFLCWLLAAFGTVEAQQARFTAQVSKKNLVVGERFQLEFTINTQASHFTPPDLGDFRLLSGPNQSSQMEIVNGRMSSNFSFSYILMAVKEGEFTIAPAAIKVGNDILKTNEITVTVEKSGSTASPGSSSQQQSTDVTGTGDKSLFMRAIVSKSDPYIGEQITVTYKLYYRSQIVDYSLSKNPSFNGFWSQDIEIQQNQSTEYVNGERYNVAELRQAILFPQRSGTLEIDPLAMTFMIRQQSQRRPQSLFDQFFGTYQDVKREIQSNSLSIKVKELPANKPASFRGAVGKFDMAVDASKKQLKANESIDLKITISGTGNLKLIQDPELKLPPDFEVYDPDIDDQINVRASGVSGSRTYKYLIIPRHKGNYTIDPVKFSYFDPSSRSYKTIASEPIEVTVEKGDVETESPVYTNVSKEDIKILGNDIKYIKPSAGDLRIKGSHFYGSSLFYLLLAIPVLLFIVFLFIRNYYRKLYSDQHRVRSSKATKVAKKRLATAQLHLKAGEKNPFFEEISKALYGYTADKLNMAYGDISKDKIREQLTLKGISEAHVGELIDIIETSEMARFAPVSSNSSKDIYDRAAEVIKNIENEIKV